MFLLIFDRFTQLMTYRIQLAVFMVRVPHSSNRMRVAAGNIGLGRSSIGRKAKGQ